MTYVWQTDLKEILEADPFIRGKVIEWGDWKSRGRPPEQFSFAPSGHICHHTACFCKVGHDPATCANNILVDHGDVPAPISQYLGTATKPGTKWTGSNPDPHVVLLAAGRANHAGLGVYPWGAPSGNGSSIAGEWCGPFAFWPEEVTEFRRHVEAAICRARGWPSSRLLTHHSYSDPVDPGRKSDASGAWVRQPGLSLNTPWDVNIWQGYVDELLNPQEDDVTVDELRAELDPIKAEIADIKAKLPALVDDTRFNRFATNINQRLDHVDAVLDRAVGRNLDARAFRAVKGGFEQAAEIYDTIGDQPSPST